MSLFIYRILLRCYQLLVYLVSPLNKKAKLWINGRKNYFTKLENALKGNTFPIAWFHCASLGEFEQARPLIEKVKEDYKNHRILVTFFSPSGYEIRKNYNKADFIFYLPLDTSANAKRFIQIVNPQVAFFAKYEFWHYFAHELKQNNIPSISFSAIFREEQIFFKPYGSLFRDILKKFDMIFVQDKESKKLLESLQISHVQVAGDTRFDRVKTICDNKKSFQLIESFKENKKILVAGSTWRDDHKILISMINNTPDIKIIIAPHEIDNNEINWVINQLNKKAIRYSLATENNIKENQVLIIDNIGMLSSLYQYGEFAYIGGAFGKGLHNILEAATFGMPIFFGPKFSKFKEARDLVKLGSAISINNEIEFNSSFENLLKNDSLREDLALKSKNYVLSNTGATDQILNYCKNFLN